MRLSTLVSSKAGGGGRGDKRPPRAPQEAPRDLKRPQEPVKRTQVGPKAAPKVLCQQRQAGMPKTGRRAALPPGRGSQSAARNEVEGERRVGSRG